MSLLKYGFTKTKCEDSGSNSSDDVVFIENVTSPKTGTEGTPKASNEATPKPSVQATPKSSNQTTPKPSNQTSPNPSTHASPKSSINMKSPKQNISKEESKNKPTGSPEEKVTPKKVSETSAKKIAPKVLNKSSKILTSPSQVSNLKTLTPKIPKMFSPKQANQIEPSPKVKSKVEIKDTSPRKSFDNSLPAQRIKLIMKSCPDVEIVPQESLQIVTRATELFVQQLAANSLQAGQRLDYDCLSNHVHSSNSLEFLKETVPKKITWAECQKLIARNKQKETDVI